MQERVQQHQENLQLLDMLLAVVNRVCPELAAAANTSLTAAINRGTAPGAPCAAAAAAAQQDASQGGGGEGSRRVTRRSQQLLQLAQQGDQTLQAVLAAAAAATGPPVAAQAAEPLSHTRVTRSKAAAGSAGADAPPAKRGRRR